MPSESDRSFSELLQDIVTNVEQTVRAEAVLARTELKQEALRAAPAGRGLAVGAALALCALGFLLLGCVYALETAIPAWAAALTIGAAAGIIAAVLLKSGVRRISQVGTPEKTVHP